MSRDKPTDQRFVQTMQVRVRRKNPAIDRPPDSSGPDATSADAPAPPTAEAASAEPKAPLPDDNSELGSIYDRLEQTDRTDELAQAQAELESALEGFGPDSTERPAVIPKSPPSLEDTKTFMGAPEPEDPRERAPTRPSDERPRVELPAAPPAALDRTAKVSPASPTPDPGPARAEDVADTDRGSRIPTPQPAPAVRRTPPPEVVPAHPGDELATVAAGAPKTRKKKRKGPVPADRLATAIETAAAPAGDAPAPPASQAPTQRPRKLTDPTTRGRAAPPIGQVGQRLDTEPTPTLEDAPPRAAVLLDDDETVLAAEPPRAGRHWTDNNEPGIRLVRRSGPRSPAPPEPTPVRGARPRDRLALLGTDAAGAVLKEHAIHEIGEALPNVRVPALKLVRSELSAAELATLERIFEGDFDEATQDATTSPKRALERLVNERPYCALTAKEQANLLRTIAATPGDVTTIKAGIALLKTGVAKRLTHADRQSLLRVFGSLSPEARVRIAQLGARKLRGRSALEDKDVQDQTLVTHLEHLACGRGYAETLDRAGLGRTKAVQMVLGAVAHPERLSFEEGSPGVLGMLEFGLADTAPAEFARLWRHLVFDDMVAPLAGQAALDLGQALKADDAPTISGADTPLRVALGQLAQLARPPGRGRKPTFIMPGGHGVDADVVSRSLELLFGFGFTVAAGSRNAMRHLERVPDEAMRLPPVFVTVLFHRGERLFLFDHMDDDWVYLRAPRGRSSKQRGALRVDPKREVVDPERALDRIPREGFEDKVGVGLIPRL